MMIALILWVWWSTSSSEDDSVDSLSGGDVDQPVHWCLDTLHRHHMRCKDRPYGGKLPRDIDRISSLFY